MSVLTPIDASAASAFDLLESLLQRYCDIVSSKEPQPSSSHLATSIVSLDSKSDNAILRDKIVSDLMNLGHVQTSGGTADGNYELEFMLETIVFYLQNLTNSWDVCRRLMAHTIFCARTVLDLPSRFLGYCFETVPSARSAVIAMAQSSIQAQCAIIIFFECFSVSLSTLLEIYPPRDPDVYQNGSLVHYVWLPADDADYLPRFPNTLVRTMSSLDAEALGSTITDDLEKGLLPGLVVAFLDECTSLEEITNLVALCHKHRLFLLLEGPLLFSLMVKNDRAGEGLRAALLYGHRVGKVHISLILPMQCFLKSSLTSAVEKACLAFVDIPTVLSEARSRVATTSTSTPLLSLLFPEIENFSSPSCASQLVPTVAAYLHFKIYGTADILRRAQHKVSEGRFLQKQLIGVKCVEVLSPLNAMMVVRFRYGNPVGMADNLQASRSVEEVDSDDLVTKLVYEQFVAGLPSPASGSVSRGSAVTASEGCPFLELSSDPALTLHSDAQARPLIEYHVLVSSPVMLDHVQAERLCSLFIHVHDTVTRIASLRRSFGAQLLQSAPGLVALPLQAFHDACCGIVAPLMLACVRFTPLYFRKLDSLSPQDQANLQQLNQELAASLHGQDNFCHSAMVDNCACVVIGVTGTSAAAGSESFSEGRMAKVISILAKAVKDLEWSPIMQQINAEIIKRGIRLAEQRLQAHRDELEAAEGGVWGSLVGLVWNWWTPSAGSGAGTSATQNHPQALEALSFDLRTFELLDSTDVAKPEQHPKASSSA